MLEKIPEITELPDETVSFGSFEAKGGLLPSLKSVTIHGKVNGLTFKSSIRQEYKNETNKTLEAVYTFPLARGTSLLGLHVEIGDKYLEGVVIEKKVAEEKYEESITKGDTPVMVQQSTKGLYTANLGNIKAGESVSVEITCARLLRFERGRIRLCIPTVIGERYGDSHMPGGLAPHESVKADATASYPLSLSLRLLGEAAKGGISCPTHPIISSTVENGLSITLDEGALLDRDFVLLLEGVKSKCFAQCVRGEEEHLVLASFVPSIPLQDSSPLALKILVDCSGSMSGQRIEHARQGLQQVLKELLPNDRVSYSCFGSEVRHLVGELRPCSPAALEDLSSKIAETGANMGGTEMGDALASTFNDIILQRDNDSPPSVLLITDGDVWDINGIIKAAKSSGHRIFVVGVGSAPGESLLKDMAEQTGGACEFVTHNENMAKAIIRMFHRMRGPTAQSVEIDWGFKPFWQSALPTFIYDGETIHCYAIAANKPRNVPALSWAIQKEVHSVQAEQLEFTSDLDILRLGKSRQLQETEPPTERLKIAFEHQLLSENTSFFLVYVRDGKDKLVGLPTLQQIGQMPVYRHGCTGGVSPLPARHPGVEDAFIYTETDWHHGVVDASIYAETDYCIPAYLRRRTAPQATPPVQAQLLGDLQISSFLRLWQQVSYKTISFQEGLDMVLKLQDSEEAALRLEELGDELGLSVEQVWAVFIHWALEIQNERPIGRHEQRILGTVLPSISQALITKARQRFAQDLAEV